MDFAKVSLAILYLISYIPGRFAEIFTSTYQLSTLLDLDIVLNQALEKYIQDETTRLENLKTYLRLKRQKSRVAFHGLSGNPVNYFTSSRKFLKGLKDVETVVKRKQHKQGQSHALLLLIVMFLSGVLGRTKNFTLDSYNCLHFSLIK